MDPSSSAPHNGRPTERTPLIAHPDSAEPLRAVGLPAIAPVVAQLDGRDLSAASPTDFCPYTLTLRAQQTAYTLCVALHIRALLRTPTKYSRDVYDRWAREKRDAEALLHVDEFIMHTWATTLDECSSTEEILDILWTAFPWDTDSGVVVRGESLTFQGNS